MLMLDAWCLLAPLLVLQGKARQDCTCQGCYLTLSESCSCCCCLAAALQVCVVAVVVRDGISLPHCDVEADTYVCCGCCC
jgi:hypothetical protein